MQSVRDLSSSPEEPASEHTQIQRKATPQSVPIAELDYHLFVPHRSHDPLLESAYEVWRDVWRSTWEEANVSGPMYSDEFTRQDEVGVLSYRNTCISVTGMRWLDLSRARSREDSYFKTWPKQAVSKVSGRFVCVGSNTAVHPAWRRIMIDPANGQTSEAVRVSFAAIALTIRRFVASRADSLLCLTRNDRSIDRVLSALGALTPLERIEFCGIETDIICLDRDNARPDGAVVDELWRRRHQA